MSQKSKMNIPMLAACILLCLTLFSIHLTSGLYARYVTNNDGNDGARVAAFDVDAAWGISDITIVANLQDNGSYSFTVTNDSEVDVKYDLVLTFSRDFPKEYLKVSIGDKEGEPNGAVVYFDNVGTLDSNGDSATHELIFTVTNIDALVNSSSGENSGEMNVNIEFDAVVRCEQID